jgi:elongation factor Ts
MSFTAKDVQALREMTGVGMMDCKKALTETDGDFEKAVAVLREKGLAAAEKKAGRIAAEGIVDVVVKGNVGAIIEINSETDFVAKNEKFREFVNVCANSVIDFNPKDVDELLSCEVDGETIEEQLREKILTIGENIKIRRFERYEGILVPYVHAGGTHAVIVNFDADDKVAENPDFIEFGKNIAMQITAVNPQYLAKEDVPAEVIEKEKEILMNQAINEGKPANIAEKMVAGRLNKFYKENVLIEQPYVKDDKISVGKYVSQESKNLASEIAIKAFTRYEKGEGLEKRDSCSFAEEVAEMQK